MFPAAHVHVFANVGNGRQFDKCQVCFSGESEMVCTDCDVEACAKCVLTNGGWPTVAKQETEGHRG